MQVKMQNGTAILRDTLAISYKGKHCLSIWPSNPSLISIEMKIYIHTKACEQMFIAAL